MDLKSELRKYIYGEALPYLAMSKESDYESLVGYQKYLWDNKLASFPSMFYGAFSVDVNAKFPEEAYNILLEIRKKEFPFSSSCYSPDSHIPTSTGFKLFSPSRLDFENGIIHFIKAGGSFQVANLFDLGHDLGIDFKTMKTIPLPKGSRAVFGDGSVFTVTHSEAVTISTEDYRIIFLAFMKKENVARDEFTKYSNDMKKYTPDVIEKIRVRAKELLEYYAPVYLQIAGPNVSYDYQALAMFASEEFVYANMKLPKSFDLTNYPITKKESIHQFGYTEKLSSYGKELSAQITNDFLVVSKMMTNFKEFRTALSLWFSPNFSNFNKLIAVRDNYNKYQTSVYVFLPNKTKESLNDILGNNFLKLIGYNLSVLNDKFSASGSDLENFIRLTTMGYLKQGDIVTTDLMPFFKVDDEITGIMNRITAISPTVNGVKVVPSFVTNIIGTDVTPTSVPNGKMVLKVVNDILIEADKFFKWGGL